MKDEKILAEILDDCLERITRGGETVEQCLARYPEQAEALIPLLGTAAAVKRVAVVSPRPEFKARARAQFQAALHEATPRRKPSFFSLRFPQWAVAVSVVAAVSLGGGGVVAAANQSLPDSPLYAMKLATEEMRLNLTTSPVGKADLQMQLADRRVTEIAAMAVAGNSDGVFRATEQLNSNLIGIAGELGAPQGSPNGGSVAPSIQAAPDTGGSRFSSAEITVTKAAATTDSFTAPVSENGTMGVAAAPAASSPQSSTTVPETNISPGSENQMTGAGGALDPERRHLQMVLLQSQAANLELLYLRLDQATDASVQGALFQAIAVSQAGYQRALETLAQP